MVADIVKDLAKLHLLSLRKPMMIVAVDGRDEARQCRILQQLTLRMVMIRSSRTKSHKTDWPAGRTPLLWLICSQIKYDLHNGNVV